MLAMLRSATALALCLNGALMVQGSSSYSPAANGASGRAASFRSVAAKQVEELLHTSLRAEIEGGGEATEKLLAAIERSLWPTFQAMPKNEVGRVSQRAVRYLVHHYFAKEHGWLLRGFEPGRLHTTSVEMHEVGVLQAKAPGLVEAMFQARSRDHGFSFSDTVAMAATLEQLILEESNTLLEASYQLNAQVSKHRLDEKALHEVLRSFLLLFRSNTMYNLSNVEGHLATKAMYVQRSGPLWRASVAFEESAVSAFNYRHQAEVNLFSEERYSFDMASEIVVSMTQAYGKWQHEDCLEMKGHLMQLDPTGGRSGRVPLSVFHSVPRTGKYSFTETAEYLRAHGALDETGHGEPKVLIANYLGNPSNCIAESSYFSVCCLSECEVLLNGLEAEVKAPTASADELVNLVSNLSSSSVDAPRELSRGLVTKMHSIAAASGDAIPLHGRLFAQWMHYAFPAECPFPRASADATMLTASQWLSEDESDATKRQDELAITQWSDEEILPLYEPSQTKLGDVVRMVMRCFFGVAALVVALRFAATAWHSAMSGTSLLNMDAKTGGSAFGMLPMHAKQV